MKTNGKTLTPKHDQAIAALLTTPTLKAAAQEAGVSVTTLWRYLQDPTFQARYRDARGEAMHQVTTRLQVISMDAVEVLGDVMAGEYNGPNVRVAAARTVLALAFKARELEDLEARLDALEARLEEGNRGWIEG